MTSNTLLDAQPSVQDFLNEAEICALNGQGFAAMCTVFPVILAVSEAVHPHLTTDAAIIDAFVGNMADRTSWWIPPASISTKPTDSDIAQKVIELRNALAHELSQPVDVVLVNTVTDVLSSKAAPRDKWYIGTTEFVTAVRESTVQLIASQGHMPFDPRPRGSTQRGPTVGSTQSWGPSASGLDVS